MLKAVKAYRKWRSDTRVCADVAEGQKDLSKHKTHSRLREEKQSLEIDP